jgi:fatty-acyl-CoA synthase
LFVLGRLDDLLIINDRNLFAHEIENLMSRLDGLTPGRALACAEFEPRTGAARLLILGEPSSNAADIKALEAEIRILVLAETGIFPGTVRFLPRGFC